MKKYLYFIILLLLFQLTEESFAYQPPPGATGQLIYNGGSLQWKSLSNGTSGQCVQSQGTGNPPTWGACGSGSTVTWPTSADIVISNSTSTPAGLAPVNGDCVVGSAGAWVAGSCSGTPPTLATIILPSSVYTADVAGNLYPNIYTGAGGNASASESGWAVPASLGSNVTLQMRFPMPSSIPSSGTFKLVSYCLANATTGIVKYTVQDANVASGSSPSAATLNSETQTSITWSAADVYVVTKTALTETPTADSNSVIAVTFDASGWTLAQPVTCRWVELWE